MIEPWLVDLLKQSPAIGAIVAIVYLGMKWHERISGQWLASIAKMDERHEAMSMRFLESVKEIGEKCHHAHAEIAKMYYEQSCKGQEVLTQVAVHMSHFARAEEQLSRAVERFSEKS